MAMIPQRKGEKEKNVFYGLGKRAYNWVRRAGPWGHCCEPSGTYITKASACLWSCLWYSLAWFQGAAGIQRVFSLGTSDLRLCFADDVALWASSFCDLQHALGWFAAECEGAMMRVCTSKSEAMVLCQKTMNCPLQVGGEFLPRVKELKGLVHQCQ